MTSRVVVSFPRSESDASRVSAWIGGDRVVYHEGIFPRLFSEYREIVCLMSSGIVIRKIAPLLKDKWSDPAVVVVDPGMKFAIPLTGGHHGANALAFELGGLGMVPVITTATESRGLPSVETVANSEGCRILNRDSTKVVNAAILDGNARLWNVPAPGMVIAGPGVSVMIRKEGYAVGIGTRKGVSADEVIDAVREALRVSGLSTDDIAVYATTAKKMHEKGLTDAIAMLGGTLVLLDDGTINSQQRTGPSAASRIGLSGVAEPCARAVSERGEFLMEKKVFGRVTIAVAR